VAASSAELGSVSAGAVAAGLAAGTAAKAAARANTITRTHKPAARALRLEGSGHLRS